ncbi:MAG: prepilin-type N-terminal cleavage/methylation domain-containing protein [Nitrospirae bacterium]|nr:prepilin-type N-terminal cleavage/methylation domain-containing protein [Nitrospirota bacterium]
MRGFTLIELLIVLVLIAVILGISVVSFTGSMQKYKFYAAVREFSATMGYAHRLAQIEGNSQVLTLDLDRKRYGIEGRGYKSIDPRIAVIVMDAAEGEIRRGIYTFVFRPIGGAEGGTVTLSSGKKIMRIELDPVVGSVVVK